ncbi:hypothetical protein QVA72_07930 [Staphylococcus simulans]|uniref:DUF3784 domain-containing protein n=2 Tax=Staphylococcus simulans TaxID=1286 RepID=A0A6N3EN19_STASI|nr:MULTISPECIES: hypothetical protein [Staphylococcus]EKS26780.1 hypothetical protein HMPREF9310_00624 [Staphylococcus simulans ACS-120-V-Sch1]ERS94536.1 hypothetical protein SSIM_00150 [Staphylococcus simulans UMC-CNS-990]MBO0387064.1 hypothetical protein [Staphylococcus simulans]MBU6943886.1 hypothetical protein [Staphylococcus sp. CWZ226]MCE5148044.1 hypothetical protein [Staphylococcus simulans]
MILLKIIIPIVTLVAFAFAWRGFLKNYMPSEAVDVQTESHYDERQTKIILEVLAKTFIITILLITFAFLNRTLGLVSAHSFISKYPEAVFLVIIMGSLVYNYVIVKRKYS